uniref:Growth differentiation factor 5 opposite strand n=1 Tax=Panthera tigris altaica TaxID=74533 RepID=A0A8C9JSS8_PANTA
MIQSSQPMSLKLTCSAFRLQRALGFLLGRLPWPVASGARLFRRWLNRYSYTVLSSWPERALISLKNRSRFLVRPNTRNRAFSWTCLAARSKPRPRRSMARPRSQASSSRHSWAVFLKFRKSFQISAPSSPSFSRALMSNTYLCFLTTGPRSSRENTQKSFPATSPREPVTSRPQGRATLSLTSPRL